MAWVAEKTFTVGAILPASDLNTYLRDNASWLKGMMAGAETELLSPKSWGDRPKGVAPAYATTTGAVIYTVPSSTVAIVTGIALSGLATDTVSVTAGGKLIAKAETLVAFASRSLDCFRVLAAGETIVATTTGGNTNIFAYPVVWEIPSTYAGLTLREARSAGAVAAATSTQLIAPTAGKALVVRHVMVEMTASGGWLLLTNGSGLYFYSELITPPGGLVRYDGEILIPDGGALNVYATNGATSWAVAGWEV